MEATLPGDISPRMAQAVDLTLIVGSIKPIY